MKAIKLAGIRLVNYINDGINWKDHKDIVLDFWIAFKCRDSGYAPGMFKGMHVTDDLPVAALEAYTNWFNSYEFMNTEDPQWIKFVDGTLNIFYHTNNPLIMPAGTWYVQLMKSEAKAREIVDEQMFHGNPNINSFWQVSTNTKSEEVGGRRNGFIFSRELVDTTPKDTRNFYWAVAFQCPDSVKLYYQDGNIPASKIIGWAADATHMVLLKVLPSGRFQVIQSFVPGKAGKPDRYSPDANIPPGPNGGRGLVAWFNTNYMPMFGTGDAQLAIQKKTKELINERKNSVNTMNDEEVKIGKLIPNVNNFIMFGNTTPERREHNKLTRRAIREKNRKREAEVKKRLRERTKQDDKNERAQRQKMNPLMGK
jgi:hypothetical protein